MDKKDVVVIKNDNCYCPECQETDMFKRLGLTCCEGCCRRK